MHEITRRTVLGGVASASALAALPAVPGVARATAHAPLRPERLTTEHLTDPLGIDVRMPRLGWRLTGSGRDRRQTAYRVLVASTRDLLVPGRADLWDSGRVRSGQQSAVAYHGAALRSRTRCYWNVRVWDESGRQGPASETAWFETALLDQDDWTAQWVGSGAAVTRPTRVLEPQPLEPDWLDPGGTLGQTFRTDAELVAVAVLLGVEREGASCTLTLREEGPGGTVVASRRLDDLAAGEAQGRLDLDERAEPGRYYAELSDVRGRLGWLSTERDAYEGGSAHRDGAAVAGDRWTYGLPPDPPPNPVLRTELQLPGEVTSARLYVAGLGTAVAWVNGTRVGDAEVSPATTDYDVRSLYTTHDVTSLLRQGGNAVGVALGRGFYATRAADSDGSNLARWVDEPRLRAQLEVVLRDGRTLTFGTGDGWQLTEGPTTYEGVYAGESYDARRAAELGAWTSPGYRADGWRPATVVPGPGGSLQAYAVEPVRAERGVRPERVTTPVPGVRLYDFGVVRTGWARLRGRFRAGTTVRLLYSEKLGASGRIEVGAAGGTQNPSVDGRFQVDEYTASGDGVETWEPSFNYKGFRYVEVSGTDRPVELVAVPVQSDVADTMDLELGHPVLQWIADAFRQTTRNGLHGHPDVAPMYTKLGWLGTAHHAIQPMLYQFGLAGVFGKWLDDIRLAQADTGEIPIIAPQGIATGGQLFAPASTITYPYLVRRYWLTYGDRTVPKKHFDAVRGYVDWLLGQLDDGIARDQFGDWYPPNPSEEFPSGPEGTAVVGTAYTISTLRDAVALADLLGHARLARIWRRQLATLVRRFNEEFLDAASSTYRTSIPAGYRQASNAIPLAFDLVPDDHVERVAARLARQVERNDRHLDTGSAGTSALPYALSDHGNDDLALAVLTQRTYPSYGYLRDLGGTTLWESWEEDSRGHNDPTLSSPVRWFVERVVGVEAVEPGWARFRVAPSAFGDLPHAGVRLDTVRGEITARWRRRGDRVDVEVRVPVNAVAELELPDGTRKELGSGRYRFTSALPRR